MKWLNCKEPTKPAESILIQSQNGKLQHLLIKSALFKKSQKHGIGDKIDLKSRSRQVLCGGQNLGVWWWCVLVEKGSYEMLE